MVKSLVIRKSTKPGKKLQAIFTRPSGRTKITHFGQAGADDYTLTKDKEPNDPTRAGFLSYYILWGSSTSRQQNIKTYKKRFGFT